MGPAQAREHLRVNRWREAPPFPCHSAFQTGHLFRTLRELSSESLGAQPGGKSRSWRVSAGRGMWRRPTQRCAQAGSCSRCVSSDFLQGAGKGRLPRGGPVLNLLFFLFWPLTQQGRARLGPSRGTSALKETAVVGRGLDPSPHPRPPTSCPAAWPGPHRAQKEQGQGTRGKPQSPLPRATAPSAKWAA